MTQSNTDALIERLRAENDRLSALVHVPGAWRCAKCNFTLIQSNLNAHDGTVTARDDPGDKCPNDASPLWRVSYRDWCAENEKGWEEHLTRKEAAIASQQSRIEALEAALDWYAEQVAGCRKLGRIGDPFRHALDRDGGARAVAALKGEPKLC